MYLVLAGSASSVASTWIGGTGSWFTSGNWSGGVPGPGPGGEIVGEITNGGTAQIFGASAQTGAVGLGQLVGQSGTLVVQGILDTPSDLTLSLSLVVGLQGNGTLQINRLGSVTAPLAYIGSSPFIAEFGNATVTVSGTNAKLNATSSFQFYSGTMTISNGGSVTSSSASQQSRTDPATMLSSATTTLVTGAGSQWTISGALVLGGTNTAVITTSDSGVVSVAGQASIGAGTRIDIGSGGVAGTLTAGGVAVGGTLQFNHTGAVAFASPLTGAGLVLKNGAGSSTITSAAGFTGAFIVNSGELILKNTLGAAEFGAGGTLRFDAATVNLGVSAIQAFSGGGVEYNNSTINGGFLRGSGTHTVLAASANATFKGVTTFNSTNIVQNGAASFVNFTNGGSLTSNAAANFSGFTNTSSGVLTVNNQLLAEDFTNNGVFTLNNGGTLDVFGRNLVSGGGSRTTINADGVVFVSDDTTWELNGALLVNNGEINLGGALGALNVNYGSLAKGSGNFAGPVNVNDGGEFSPGNSPGVATVGALNFNAGGRYLFELRDAAGAAGSGFDLTHSLGALTLAAGTTPNTRFTIEVTSLDAANAPGLAGNFDPAQNREFVLVQAGGGIAGFDAAEFAIDLSGFQNDLAGGAFSIAASGNDLLLVFAPVPEPSTCALLLLGAGALSMGVVRWRWDRAL